MLTFAYGRFEAEEASDCEVVWPVTECRRSDNGIVESTLFGTNSHRKSSTCDVRLLEESTEMDNYRVGYLIGSLAAGSINRKLAKALVRLAPAELEMEEISFRDLPLYSYDYDANFPAPARAFKEA